MKDDITITPLHQPGSILDPLTEIAREGARQMLAAALRAEAASFVAQFEDERLPDGRHRIVRHGTGPERMIQTGIGPIPVQRQKVRDRASGVPAEKRIRFGGEQAVSAAVLSGCCSPARQSACGSDGMYRHSVRRGESCAPFGVICRRRKTGRAPRDCRPGLCRCDRTPGRSEPVSRVYEPYLPDRPSPFARARRCAPERSSGSWQVNPWSVRQPGLRRAPVLARARALG